MTTTYRRIVAAGAVAAGMLWAGTGTAAADPPADRGSTFPTEGAAFASLSTPDGSLSVFLSVFDPPGEEPIAGVEVFGTDPTYGPYECWQGPMITASFRGLAGASAEGSTTLLCGGEHLPDDVVAHVSVDATWKAVGPVDRSTVVIPGMPCATLNRQRAAEVTGPVTVEVPALGVEATLPDGFGDVRRLTSICAGGRD